MVYFHSSISLCNTVDQPPPNMANSTCSSQNNTPQRNRKTPSSSNSLQIPPCDRSRSFVVVDVVIFLAVISAFAFLLFPYIQFLITETVKIGRVMFHLAKQEFFIAPRIYISLGLSVICVSLATWGVVAFTTRKCGNPNCKGLRNAAEFDIQLETEDFKDGHGCVKKGLFKLPCDHHRELEAELKKMAPINGRAVLVIRARCGCSVGRLEVQGPKKNRKIKK